LGWRRGSDTGRFVSVAGAIVLPQSTPTFFRFWMAGMAMYYFVVALALVIPSQITEHYKSR
jgi:hypothetical protein